MGSKDYLFFGGKTMSIMDNIENVKEQYRDDNNLSLRSKLHAKHSTNKQGFSPWLFEKYKFSEGYRILELGCGNGGMRTYLRNAFKQVNLKISTFTKDISFNLQNGKEMLSQYFEDVQRCDFEDSLSITETQDLIDWLKSTITIASYSENDLSGFYEYFEGIRQKEGAINIPKETGLFISTKV